MHSPQGGGLGFTHTLPTPFRWDQSSQWAGGSSPTHNPPAELSHTYFPHPCWAVISTRFSPLRPFQRLDIISLPTSTSQNHFQRGGRVSSSFYLLQLGGFETFHKHSCKGYGASGCLQSPPWVKMRQERERVPITRELLNQIKDVSSSGYQRLCR